MSGGCRKCKERRRATGWCVACGGPNRVVVIQDSMDRDEAKVFGARAPPNGVRENFMCSLKLLATVSEDEAGER